jgi:hypothetical protein
MTTAGSNFISGISTFTQTTDVVNKDYVDNYPSSSSLPSQTGNEGKFLTTTDGTSTSWDYVSNYQEFTTTGEQTFTVPSYANLLYIEAVGAGGGGGAGQTTEQAGATWTLRTGGVGANYNYTSFTNNLFFGFGGGLNTFRSSTDGINWVPNSNYGFNTITFGNGTYVAGGLNGVFGSSTDAITWILRTSGIGGNSMVASIFNNNTYIFGGLNGQIITSTDAITWILRTSGIGSGKEIQEIIFQNNSYIACSGTLSLESNLIVSTDTIVWTRRTSGFGTISINSITFGNNLYVAGGASGRLNTSTDTIHWTLRTAGFGANSIVGVKYGGNYIIVGSSAGLIASSTDAITWTLRTVNTTQAIRSLRYGNNTYIATGDSSFLASSYAQASGTGGSSGSYTSWYIPKNIVSSNLTVNPGVGGAGATTDAGIGSAGAGTTVSWTGPGGTYTITANGGGDGGVAGSAQLASQSSSFYTTAGLSGAPQSLIGAGLTATTQTNQYQPTGGGSGAGSTVSSGGSGGTINVYGISTSASGGDSSGTNGFAGIAYTGIPYGSGGGGGGASVSIAATGGNGARGGGGGGGASIGSTFGNGGNGGDGYVKITWW